MVVVGNMCVTKYLLPYDWGLDNLRCWIDIFALLGPHLTQIGRLCNVCVCAMCVYGSPESGSREMPCTVDLTTHSIGHASNPAVFDFQHRRLRISISNIMWPTHIYHSRFCYCSYSLNRTHLNYTTSRLHDCLSKVGVGQR